VPPRRPEPWRSPDGRRPLRDVPPQPARAARARTASGTPSPSLGWTRARSVARRRCRRSVARLHSSGIAVALLTVLASSPVMATACPMLCAPARHEPGAVEHHGGAACHQANATVPVVAAAPDHDCRTHLGAARDVLATVAPPRHDHDPRGLPAILPMNTRVFACATARPRSSHGPPLDPVLPQRPPRVLRI